VTTRPRREVLSRWTAALRPRNGNGSDPSIPWTPVCDGHQPVLCLPGLDGSRALVDQLIPHLEGHTRLIWANYNHARGLTYEAAVRALQRAVEEHCPRLIIAESFGSTVAVAWALEHPDQQIPLVLTGPLSWVRRRWCTGWGRFAAWITPDTIRPAVVWMGSQFVISRRGGRQVRRDLIRDFCRIPRRAWLDRLSMLLEVDLRARLREIRQPVTLLWGEDDRVVFSQDEAEIFRSAGHGHAIRILPGIGHSLWAEHPEAVAEEVRRVLRAMESEALSEAGS
jgi:pimeloyl-ACP methyl ester carboxylesterase